MYKIDIKPNIERLNNFAADKNLTLNMFVIKTYYISEALFLLTNKIW